MLRLKEHMTRKITLKILGKFPFGDFLWYYKKIVGKYISLISDDKNYLC